MRFPNRNRADSSTISGALSFSIALMVCSLVILTGCTENDNGQSGDTVVQDGQETTDLDITVSDSSSTAPNTTDTAAGTSDDTPDTYDSTDLPDTSANDSASDDSDGDTSAKACPPGFEQYSVDRTDRGVTSSGCKGLIEVNKDEVDLFVPVSSGVFPVLIFMQGAKVEKSHYSEFAKRVSSYGVIVAVPNHSSMMGKYFTEQKVFNNVWETLRTENELSQSALFGKVDTESVSVMGHSFGGTVASNVVQNKCQFPSCTGNLKTPQELGAALFYGFNNVNPLTGDAGPTNNIAPVMYIAGELNDPQKTERTYNKTQNSPKFFVEVMGANHYAVTNTNNPEGANPDNSTPTIEQDVATKTIADWSGVFLRAYLHGDVSALDYLINIGDTEDDLVTVKGVE